MKRAPVACLALATTSAAWASYGQMRLDGIVFFLAIAALFFWALLLVTGLLVGLGRYIGFAWIATVITVLLTAFLVFAWPDGRATMRPRPLTGPAMYVVLTLVAIPVMLAAPFLKFAGKGRPVLWLSIAVALAPVGSIAYSVVQDIYGERVMERAKALAPGQVGAHVDASLRRASGSRLSPFLWSAQEESKWMILGLGQMPTIDNAAPLPDADAKAIASLVRSAAGTPNEWITGKLQGKLAWDQLVRAAPAERPVVVAGMSEQQARHFKEYVVEPHTDWVCKPLAEPPTEVAFVRLLAMQHENDRPAFATKIQAQCGLKLTAGTR